MPRKRTATKRTTAAKPPAKPPATKPPAKKPTPALGPFGKALYANLKNATPGVPMQAAVLETLRAVPQAQLKAAVSSATPKEKAQLFSVLPGDQIASSLRALPASFLAPATPPTPPPAPAGGPPASILMTTYENVVYPPAQKDPLWAQKITGGNTVGIEGGVEWLSVYDPRFEKEGSLNNPVAGLTGWAVQGDLPISSADIWFVHPWGNDFQFYVVPDPQYQGLCGGSNRGINPISGDVDTEYNEATAVAGPGLFNADGSVKRKGLGLTAPKGVIGVEIDNRLVPPAFQNLIEDGARVAVFGRWIVDCGHDDFHTEIHPPLLTAVATVLPPPAGRPAGSGKVTQVQIISRPYTISQLFDGGTTNFAQHLAEEIAKVEDTTFGIPHSFRVEAHPTIITPPYDGRPYIKLLVQPPPFKQIGPITRPRNLMVSFHFTHREGVVAQVFDAGNGTVGIIIVLGDMNPAELPRNTGQNVEWSQLQTLEEAIYVALEIVDLLTLKVASAIILALGILTDLYEPPIAASPVDNQNIAGPVQIDQLPFEAGDAEDDNQPFPIYGWVNVWWEPVQVVVKPPVAATSTRAAAKKTRVATKTRGAATKKTATPTTKASPRAKAETTATGRAAAAGKRTATRRKGS
jgi:hypothetical protein